MFYREAGQFKSTYAADMAVFPIRLDRIGIAVILLIAFDLIDMTVAALLGVSLLFTFGILDGSDLVRFDPDAH